MSRLSIWVSLSVVQSFARDDVVSMLSVASKDHALNHLDPGWMPEPEQGDGSGFVEHCDGQFFTYNGDITDGKDGAAIDFDGVSVSSLGQVQVAPSPPPLWDVDWVSNDWPGVWAAYVETKGTTCEDFCESQSGYCSIASDDAHWQRAQLYEFLADKTNCTLMPASNARSSEESDGKSSPFFKGCRSKWDTQVCGCEEHPPPCSLERVCGVDKVLNENHAIWGSTCAATLNSDDRTGPVCGSANADAHASWASECCAPAPGPAPGPQKCINATCGDCFGRSGSASVTLFNEMEVVFFNTYDCSVPGTPLFEQCVDAWDVALFARTGGEGWCADLRGSSTEYSGEFGHWGTIHLEEGVWETIWEDSDEFYESIFEDD